MPGVDRYELQDEIGRGESGVVFRARDRLTGRLVAIKVFRREASTAEGQEVLARRLEKEARLLSRVRHPAVVEVIDTRISEDSAWLVTEYVEGETLQAVLRRRERLPPEEAIALVVQAARALACAHAQGIVHRDIKPANLLVQEDGTLKVTDFGIAGEAGKLSLNTKGRSYFLGTPAYVAPEQWLGNPVDGRADLYSLGVVLYRCLTGSRPFEGKTVREVVHRSLSERLLPPSRRGPCLPTALDELCLRALAREPGGRFPDGEAMARALEDIVVSRSTGSAFSSQRGGMDDPMERTWKRLYVQRPKSSALRAGGYAAATLLAVAAALSFSAGALGPWGKADVPFSPSSAKHAEPIAPVVPFSERPSAHRPAGNPAPAPPRQPSTTGPAVNSPRPGHYRAPDTSMINHYAKKELQAASKGISPTRTTPRATTQVDSRSSGNRTQVGLVSPREGAPTRGNIRNSIALSAELGQPSQVDESAKEMTQVDRVNPRGNTPARGNIRNSIAPPPDPSRPSQVDETAASGRGESLSRVDGKASPVGRAGEGHRAEGDGGGTSPELVTGQVKLFHSLDEGLMEILVDGRRAALVRFGTGAGQRAGEPVQATFRTPAGGHRVQVRVLSASQAVDASSGFEAEWSGEKTRSLKYALEYRRRGWKLSPR